ncbi:purine-cytosine permease family protein [Bacillus salipaludis]|uniref:Purine-cytosine permease family protein n=1 Tax=Bacillus salipaludis TaxID=2547811 RepID=A0ABW8RH87_9BACI
MASFVDLKQKMDDHALERIPENERKSWIQLSNNTMGVCSTIVIMMFGALATFSAGMKLGLLAGVVSVIIGTIIGFLIGNIARKEGLSSTVITRYYGFGVKGSLVSAIVFGFMVLGFLALENALLYYGVLFFFNMEPTLLNAIVIYGIFTLAWIALALFGINLVYKVAGVTLVGLVIVLLYMIINAMGFSGISAGEVMSFSRQFGPSEGIMDFVFAVNILIGSTGGLALTAADSCRYARTRKDVLLTNLTGMLVMNIGMVIAGGAIAYIGMGKVVDHYVATRGLSPEEASAIALNDMGGFFIILAGAIGFIILFLANGKAQVLNTYSGSLALTNIFSAFGWRGNRALFVVLCNIIALIMISMNILGLVEQWLGILGVLTTCTATIVIIDYYWVKKITHREVGAHVSDTVNIAGVLTLIIATILALTTNFIPMPFVTSTIISIILYPLLRLYVFKPNLTLSQHDPSGSQLKA